jgi:nitrogenase molybdenum-cofactor synthesis protein NifE
MGTEVQCQFNVLPQRPCGLATEPGSMSQRSCVYFGARYVLGPVREAIHLVHGALGCAYYGKMVRGNPVPVFSTNMQEYDVIFGGRTKLYNALFEAFSLNPKARGAFVYLTCVSAMIGEDAESVAKKFFYETDKQVKVVSCPGFSAPSQSKGHALAYEVLFDLIKPEKPSKTPVVNLVGEYNVAGETKVIKTLLAALGIEVHTALTGDTSWSAIEKMTRANLNLLLCGSTAENFCKKMKTIFGTPYLKVSFYGLSAIRNSLEKIGAYFGIPKEQIKNVIKAGEKMVYEKITDWLEVFKNKKAMIVLGAGRLGALSRMLRELGFEVEVAASIFGRESDHFETMPYAGLLTDNPGDDELEKALSILKPDIVLTNSREEWRPIKLGVPVLSFPQPAMRGPYAGYIGMINFARDLYKCLKAPVWDLLTFSL